MDRRAARPAIATLMAALSLPAALPGASRAATWHLAPDGSGDFPDIQAALAGAASGDSVILAPGTYTGDGNRDVDFLGKEIALASSAGAAATIIDIAGSEAAPHRAFHIHDGQGGACVIAGLTIANGMRTDDDGAGVLCELSSPRFVNCVFSENRAGLITPSRGGAIAAIGASPSFEDCEFRGNCGGLAGGGIYAASGSPRFTRCLFASNTACVGSGGAASGQEAVLTFSQCRFEENHASREGGTGGAIQGYSTLITIDGSVFVGNEAAAPDSGTGGAIRSEGGEVDITGTLFAGNRAAVRGGAVSIYHGSSVITNCTFSGNAAPHGGAIRIGRLTLTLDRTVVAFSTEGAAVVCDDAGQVFAGCNDIIGNAGGDWTACIEGFEGADGNFSLDPRFCDPAASDFTVQDGSPCLPGANPYGVDCGLVGAYDRGCAGPTPVEPVTWGTVKARFAAPH